MTKPFSSKFLGHLARRQKGFTYLIALFAIAIASAALGRAAVNWGQEAQRAREAELLHIGKEFQRAIGLYYERSPGAVKRYPTKITDLLRDERYLSIQRYLRRIYRDPMTGKTEWGLVQAPMGGIMGIYSLSDAQPVKIGGFDDTEVNFVGQATYSGWKFIYTPPVSESDKRLN